MNNQLSKRMQAILRTAAPTIQYLTDPLREESRQDPEACDFLLGNPHELPLAGVTTALHKWVAPQNKDWFAYKMSEPRSQEIIARSLQISHHLPFNPEDILMTTGAFAGLSAVLALIVDPGDEVIYISPPWFFYEMLIVFYEGTPVRVSCDPDSFDLDLEAIRRAITPRTRGIIINSPNNPTGRIYPPETLQQLAELLTQASQANGRPIALLSDEAYNHIVFDGIHYPSPTAYYPNTFLIYTYGKTLLTPGQRMGYIALPPSMPDQVMIRASLTGAIVALGYTYPNALLQHALEDLERLSIDIGHLQAKRDRLVRELCGFGYNLAVPEGTFYLLVRSPLEDDLAFTDLLAEQKIYCLPGSIFELPGYFRISLTANDEMIERALPGFERVIRQVISSQ
jgi:aspartate aminotransferase